MASLRVACLAAVSLALLAALAGAAGCGFDGVGVGADTASSGASADGGPAGSNGGADPPGAQSGSDANVDPDAIALGTPDSGPPLTLTSGAAPAQLDLESEGTLAWIHWGTKTDDENSVTQKASAVGALPTYLVTGSQDIRTYEDNFTLITWTNGAPTATQSGTRNGVYSKTGKPTFHLDRVVGVEPQRFVVYAGVYKCKAMLTVTLGTGSAPITLTATLDNSEKAYGRYVIEHRAKDPGTTLTVTWQLVTAYDPNNSNVTLAAATLAALPP